MTRDLLRDAAADLLLGSHCVGCEKPGRLLCAPCREAIGGSPFMVRLDPAPTDLAPVVAAVAYGGVVRDLVIGHKERGLHALARPLGELLADAVAGLLTLTTTPSHSPVVLVPVPSRPASVRARGYDPTATLVRRAAAALRADDGDREVAVVPALRLRPGVVDQAGLDHAGRAANLAGSMVLPARRLHRLARRHPHAMTIVCDDVLTSGATVHEARRALQNVGVPVLGAAVIAATPLRWARRAG